MYFGTKNYLKSIHNHTTKHIYNQCDVKKQITKSTRT
jgi:hypothetical protein